MNEKIDPPGTNRSFPGIADLGDDWLSLQGVLFPDEGSDFHFMGISIMGIITLWDTSCWLSLAIQFEGTLITKVPSFLNMANVLHCKCWRDSYPTQTPTTEGTNVCLKDLGPQTGNKGLLPIWDFPQILRLTLSLLGCPWALSGTICRRGRNCCFSYILYIL